MGRLDARGTDLRRVLDVAETARASRPVGAGVPAVALQQLQQLVACDDASFVEFDATSAVSHLMQECVDGTVTTTTSTAAEPDHPFFRHYWTTESCSYPSRTGDEVSVTKRSDFSTDREWHASAMYQDCFREDGVEHELMCCLPSQGTRSRRLLLFRTGVRDFDERDRTVLALLRPHLAELAASPPRPRELTQRQWELMQLVAAGHTNAQIATRLHLTGNTVRKHLENIFERLQVANRTAAVAAAYGDAPAGVRVSA